MHSIIAARQGCWWCQMLFQLVKGCRCLICCSCVLVVIGLSVCSSQHMRGQGLCCCQQLVKAQNLASCCKKALHQISSGQRGSMALASTIWADYLCKYVRSCCSNSKPRLRLYLKQSTKHKFCDNTYCITVWAQFVRSLLCTATDCQCQTISFIFHQHSHLQHCQY